MDAEVQVCCCSVGSNDNVCISFWSPRSGVPIRSYKGGYCSVNGLQFVSNDYILAAQPGKQVIHIWDTNKEQSCHKVVCPDKINALCVSPDGHFVAVALKEKIFVYQLSTGSLVRILERHYQTINVLRFTDSGEHLISAGNDNLTIVWDFFSVLSSQETNFTSSESLYVVQTWSDHSLPVTDVWVGCGGTRSRIITCSLDHTCKSYDLASCSLLGTFAFENGLTAVTMDPSESYLCCGSIDGNIYVTDIAQNMRNKNLSSGNQSQSHFIGHSKRINSLSFSLDGCWILSASVDCSAKLWHVSSHQCLHTMQYKGPVTNALIMHRPPYINGQTNNKSHPPIAPFKRNLMDLNENESSLPIIFKELKQNHSKDCRKIHQNKDERESELDLIEAVMKEANNSNLINATNEDSNIVDILEQTKRMEQLEKVAQGLYKITADKLLCELEKRK